MADAFYPFVGEGPADERTSAGTGGQQSTETAGDLEVVTYPTRIAIFDDPAAAPRVVVIQPKDVRSYLEEITATVTRLAKEQGGKISFTVIREVVENLVHAYFIEPTISILNGGNTIRFSDQGPGIREKARALEYGTTSATDQMKKYIRGVGSGLPYAQQYMEDHGGTLTIEDNLNAGTIVTISMPGEGGGPAALGAGGTATARPPQQDLPPSQWSAYQQGTQGSLAQGQYPQLGAIGGYPQQVGAAMPSQNPAVGWPAQMGTYPQQGWPTPQGGFPQGYPTQSATNMPMNQGIGVQSPYQAPSQAAGQYQQWQQWAPQGWPQQATQPQTTESSWSPTPVPADSTTGTQIHLSERASNVVAYLSEHELVGPTDLVNAYGGSPATWTRQLQELEEQGVIKKQGQKRHLTELGRTLL